MAQTVGAVFLLQWAGMGRHARGQGEGQPRPGTERGNPRFGHCFRAVLEKEKIRIALRPISGPRAIFGGEEIKKEAIKASKPQKPY